MNFVSVIIPTFKRSDLLKNTIDSVLNQTYPYFEIIVVDDNEASSSYRKKTELLMSQYSLSTKIKYLKNEKNCGGSASRNNGVLASTGDFICFLDDDDTFHATKLEKQMSIMLSKDKTWGAVYCNYNFVSKNKIIRKTEHQEEGNLLFDMLSMKNTIASGSTMLIRKKVFLELNGYDTNFSRHQDWEFLVRFFRYYKLAICKDNLVDINLDSNINRVDPLVLKKAKELFFETFENDINKFTEKQIKEIESAHKQQLARLYLGNSENTEFFKVLLSTKAIPVKDLIRLTLLFLAVNIFGYKRKGY